ncbi:MAG: ribonuclease III [Desulfovibrio sp.]
MRDAVLNVQQCIHYEFQQVKLLRTALSHSSYANECEDVVEDNERLEFLGDAVLELTISEELYKRFSSAHEGQLTRIRSKLVKEESLATIARELNLENSLQLGKGEEAQGGRQRSSLLADALEAIFGAVFLDGGYGEAKKVILRVFKNKWPVTPEISGAKDYKSRLQELTQKHYKERPIYTLAGSSGPEHNKVFSVSLMLPTKVVFEGDGSSLKKAEQTAAAKAVAAIEKEFEE